MIDNYDSFTFNLVQLIQTLGYKVKTVRNDEITLAQIERLKPSHIIISPGPGRPDDAGISIATIKRFGSKIPILGVCLGHQCIIQAYGGKIVSAAKIVHGKTSTIEHDNRGEFRNLPQNMEVVRYHSLAGERGSLPECLEVSAETTDDRTIMGVRHRRYHVVGVQFHPESIGTVLGRQILVNFFHFKIEEPQKLKLLSKVMQGQDLNATESYTIMDEITDGELTESQLGAFLGALTVKGVCAIELSSFVKVLRDKTGVTTRLKGALDTCGTGGDAKHTINISSAAALICAAAGVTVAKHGNRAVSSSSGSLDFLNALGIPTQGDLNANLAAIRRHGFAFFFAPKFHSAMRHVAKVRQELKTRTVFNMIGPLANPVLLDYQLAGVFSQDILDLYIEAMKKLGRRHALAVHSYDGMDEISICAKTQVRELKNGKISAYDIDPADFGIKGYTLKDITGKSAGENAALFRQLIGRKKLSRQQRAAQAAFCLNAGAALYVADKAETIKGGYVMAQKILASKEFGHYVNQLSSVSGQ
ncbi:MAG TPA: anthranilate phosphoribosyltransferase [Candidatus Bathyarchaeia archaeon]|nr:anthranilate phosphoribosyltransferase [Candidatus Bathyarchaeia archaeon]